MPDYNTTSSLSLPYSLEAEQAVLGSILNDSECMKKISFLKQDYFFLEQHRIIYGSMLSMFSFTETKIDPVVIADALVKSGRFDTAGGREYLLTLKDSVPSVANVETYAKIVEEKYLLRTLIGVSQDLIEKAQEGSEDARTLLNFAEDTIYKIRQDKDREGPRKLSYVVLNEVYDRLGKLTGEDKELYKPVSTGFGMLDEYITGLSKSDLILIGARPAMGKTSFALNLAQNVSASGKKCLFFSLEMTKEQLAERILAANSGVDSQKLRRGDLTPDEWTRLGNAAGKLEKYELWLDDSSSLTVSDIKSTVKRMRDVDLVIVDYLGLIQSSSRKENRVQEVTEITRMLKMMAKDLNIPVVCCAQLSRGTEGRGKSHRPQLSDLRESGSIEQDADIVLFLYRPYYYKNELDEESQEDVDANLTEVIVAKNRHGGVGTVKMIFDGEFTRFRVIEEKYERQDN